MEFIRKRIRDTTLLELMERFLEAGYIEDGRLYKSKIGTPQGSILSPMLANIFLHYVLDTWYEEAVKTQVVGYCATIRYADDFVCVVKYLRAQRRLN